jgi:hypothetical protein
VQLGLSQLDRSQADEQGYAVGVRVVDADGLPVANGTEVQLSLSAGSLDETLLRTQGGQAQTQLRLPQGQTALLSAQAGAAQTSLTIDDQSRERPGQPFGRRDDRYDPAADALAVARNRLEPVGEEAQADNRSRRVTFSVQGLDYRFKTDVAAEEEAQLAFEVREVRVGQTSLMPGAFTFSHQDNWAIYEAGEQAWRLAYAVSDEGVEQYFRFEDGIPLEGDLVVESRFRTDLQPVLVSDEEGVLFYQPGRQSEEAPLLGIGPVTARDAEGRQLQAQLQVQGDRFRFTLPAAWLQRAEFPLIIDPVIGPAALVSTLQGDTRYPAAASDGSNFLTVWDWNGDIYGQLTDGEGENVGDLIAISQAEGTQYQAEVVYNPTSDDYLAAWVDRRYGSPNYSLFAQRLSITGTLIGDEIEVTEPLQNLGFFGGVSGAVNQSGETLLVWSHTESNYEVFGQLLQSSGVLTGSVITLTNASDSQRRPDVAYDGQSDTFLVVWEDERGGSEFDLYAQHLQATGALSGSNTILVDNSGPDAQYPDVSANDNGQFLVVWQQELSGSDTDITAQRVVASTGAAQGSPIDLETGGSHDRYPTGIAIPGQGRQQHRLPAGLDRGQPPHLRPPGRQRRRPVGGRGRRPGAGPLPGSGCGWHPEPGGLGGEPHRRPEADCGPAPGLGRPGRGTDQHLPLLQPARAGRPGLQFSSPGDGCRLAARPRRTRGRPLPPPGR